MRITFILPIVNMSGGIRVIAIYADALQKMGHFVKVVSVPPKKISFKKKLVGLFKTGKITFHPIPVSHLTSFDLNHTVIDRLRPIKDQDVPDADVVIATWWETAEWVTKLSEKKGKKVYFIQHHEIFENLPYERCRATYSFPLKKITIAKWLIEVMATDYKDTNVDLVPNSVDHAQFFAPVRKMQASPTIGFLQHTAHFKGVDITLSAIALLKNIYKDLKVICFGSHPPSPEKPLPDYYEFHLAPEQDNIRNIYSRCDVWMTASRSEGFNLPAMEAMACRTPVISTKAGWPAEAILTGINGALTEVNDINGLVEAACWILSRSESEWQAISQAAFDTVKDSTWEKSAKLFEESLLNLNGKQK